MKIGYIPFQVAENAYVDRNKEILSKIGDVLPVPNINNAFKNFRINAFDVIVVNWIENCIVTGGGKVSVKGSIKFLLKVLYLKLLSKKIIFVRHNNYPHRCIAKYSGIATNLVNIFEGLFDRSVTHSGHNISNKRMYVPHPLYRLAPVERSVDDASEGYFLIFGRILSYKKIVDFLNVVSPYTKIVIAGSAPSSSYLEEIKLASIGKNVKIISRHLSDSEATLLMKSANGVLITHNDPDMIVSGTFFYALSAGVPVHAVASPFFDWVKFELGCSQLHVVPNLNELSKFLEQARILGKEKINEADKQLLIKFDDSEILSRWKIVIGSCWSQFK